VVNVCKAGGVRVRDLGVGLYVSWVQVWGGGGGRREGRRGGGPI
jgi:hypothetical protein